MSYTLAVRTKECRCGCGSLIAQRGSIYAPGHHAKRPITYGRGRENSPVASIMCPGCSGSGQIDNMGAYLRTIRKSVNMTQLELAELSEYSRKQIQMVEAGKRKASIKLLNIYKQISKLANSRLQNWS